MNQKFEIYCSNISKSLESETEDDPLILEGIASTTGIDLEGDYCTEECIKSMKNQALRLNIHGDHLKNLSGVIGKVIDVIDTDDSSFKIKFSILPSFRKQIEEYLRYGVNLGLSIGGKALDYEQYEDGWKIKNILLLEISLTPLPANFDTFGSVRITKGIVTSNCLNGACKQILKSLSNDVMNENFEENGQDNLMTESKVMDMINEALNSQREEIFTILKEQYKLDDLKEMLIINQAKEDLKTEENLEGNSNMNSDKDKKQMIEEKDDEQLQSENKEEVIDTEEEVIDEEEKEDESKEKKCDDKEEKEKSSEESDLEKSATKNVTVGIETFDMNELKKQLRDEMKLEVKEEVRKELMEEVKAEVKKSVEDEILTELSNSREPVSNQKIETPKTKETNELKKNMNVQDIAKYLANN